MHGECMEITSEFIKKSRILSEGTTSYILKHESGIIYKLYKGSMDYIIKNGEYELNENETKNRLNHIINKKESVYLTDLPSEILTCNGKPVGVKIAYYKDSITLKEFLINNPDVEMFEIKQEVLKIVDELIKNGIVPTDPHLENFLVCYDNDGKYKINMIDTDDIYISAYPDGKKDVWYESEVSACYRVIDLSFDEIMNSKKVI